MAKKKINIILILIVLGLWGTVGFRALNHRLSSDILLTEKLNQTRNITIDQINKDTFELEKINRDPFLDKKFQSAIISPKKQISHYSSIKKGSAPVIIKPNPDIHWPTLTYYGYLKSKDQELVLLKIDSKLCKLKLNDPINGLIVKKKYKDSIEVCFNSQSKIIRLK
jgi:hypothetical protein